MKDQVGNAQYQNKEVIIHGGFKHPEKGHFVEVSAKFPIRIDVDNKPCQRCSVSLWEIELKDEETAEKIIFEIFKYNLETAVSIDRRKGLPAELKIELVKRQAI